MKVRVTVSQFWQELQHLLLPDHQHLQGLAGGELEDSTTSRVGPEVSRRSSCGITISTGMLSVHGRIKILL